jgi:predicted dehydrogenase
MTSPNPLRIAQIGCGQISTQHFGAYAETTPAELVTVVDVDAVAAREASEANQNVPWSTSFEETIQRDDIDAISIASPHYLHAPQAIAAAEAGKHVLCEKPLTISLEDADRMIEACERNKVALGMWMVMRYAGAYKVARNLVRAGVIGEIVNIRLPDIHNKARNYYERGVGGRARPSEWRSKRATAGGGALIMNAIHQIDVLRYVTGLEVHRVGAEWTRFTGLAEVEDMINVVLRYENGAIGTIDTANYAPGGGEAHVLRLYGQFGQIQIANNKDVRVFVERGFEGGAGLPSFATNEWIDVATPNEGNPRTLLLDDFARTVQRGESPPVTGHDGRRAIEIVLAAYKSAEDGITVNLPLGASRAPAGTVTR